MQTGGLGVLRKKLTVFCYFLAILPCVLGVFFAGSASAEVAAKTYVDDQLSDKVTKTGDESIAGVKTFTSNPLTATLTLPTADAGSLTNFVTEAELTSALTSYAKTAQVGTIVAQAIVNKIDKVTPSANGNIAILATGGAVQDSGLRAADLVVLTGDQSVGGVKTFSSIPLAPTPELPDLVP